MQQDAGGNLHSILLEALSLAEDPGARVSRWRRDTSAQADVRGTRRGGFELPGPGHAYARAAHIAAEWLDAGRAVPGLAVEGARCEAARRATSEERGPATSCLALVLAAEGGDFEAIPLADVSGLGCGEEADGCEGDDLVFAEHGNAGGDDDADVYGADASSDVAEARRDMASSRSMSPRSPHSPRSPRSPRSPGRCSTGVGVASAGCGALKWDHEWDGAARAASPARDGAPLLRAPSPEQLPARAARSSTAASPPLTELVCTSLLGPAEGKDGRRPIPVSALEAALRDAAVRTAREAREAQPQFLVGAGAGASSAAAVGERARAAARLFLASSADREVKDAEREHARREAAVARAAARTVPGAAAKKG